jgi:two-component system cell cycle sensor histidine kinase/response regulator CckA
MVQGVTRRMLQLAGYDCLVADTAIDALRYLKSGPVPDLALLDVRLPDLSGDKLALRIHQQHPHIPVLFVSGWPGESVNPDRLAALRWEFLQKPISKEVLLPAVERLLAGGQAE